MQPRIAQFRVFTSLYRYRKQITSKESGQRFPVPIFIQWGKRLNFVKVNSINKAIKSLKMKNEIK